MDNIDFLARVQPPESLFKFGCFDSERHFVDLIKNNNLYLSCPEDFNDPFDCAIAPDFENFTVEQFHEMIESAHQNIRSLREIYPDFDDNLVNFYWKHKTELADEYKTFYRKGLGVYCFSAEKDNGLMWSHYSRGHRGFCLEFTGLHLKPHWMNMGIILQPIIYSKEYPKFEPSINPEQWVFQWAVKIASTKSCIWSYEKEWRLMHPPGGARKKIQYKDTDLRSIYLGVGCKDEDIEIIKCLIKDKNPRPMLFLGRAADSKFEIIFDPIQNE